jgi:hypothetical protein
MGEQALRCYLSLAIILVFLTACSATSTVQSTPASTTLLHISPQETFLPPTMPPPVATVEPTVTPQTIELIGHIGGFTSAVFVRGHYAYVGIGPELAVLDISDPTHPRRVGYAVLPGIVRDVYVAGDYAFVADGYLADEGFIGGLRVVNVSDPSAPYQVASYNLPRPAIEIAVLGDYAYIAAEGEGLRVLDVSDVTDLKQVGLYGLRGSAQSVAVADGYAYVAMTQDGLRVLDTSNPASLTEVSAYDLPNGVLRVELSGDFAYVIGFGEVHIVDG